MKRLIPLVMLFALLINLSACSNNTSTNDTAEIETYKKQISDYTAEIETYKEQINELKQQVQELTDLLSFYTDADISVDDNTTTETPTLSTAILLGQTIRIEDIIEFTITSCSWEDKILPSNPSGVYSYKADIVDETYLVLRGKFTNLNGNSYSIDDIHDSEILINEKYSFHVFINGEDTDGAGFSYSTKPLQTVNFIIYASVSDAVKGIFEEATITINMLNDPKRVYYFFDEDDDCKNIYTIKLTKDGLS